MDALAAAAARASDSTGCRRRSIRTGSSFDTVGRFLLRRSIERRSAANREANPIGRVNADRRWLLARLSCSTNSRLLAQVASLRGATGFPFRPATHSSIAEPLAHADVGADHRLPQPHRFEDRDRHRFIARGRTRTSVSFNSFSASRDRAHRSTRPAREWPAFSIHRRMRRLDAVAILRMRNARAWPHPFLNRVGRHPDLRGSNDRGSGSGFSLKSTKERRTRMP